MMQDVLGRMCRETVVAHFRELSRYSPRGIDENCVRISDVSAKIRAGISRIQVTVKKTHNIRLYGHLNQISDEHEVVTFG
jgi:hypothetical protein